MAVSLVALTILAVAFPAMAHSQQEEITHQGQLAILPEPVRSGWVERNGVRYHYQIHGTGEPLLVLHGGLGSFEMFAPILPQLGAGRAVVGIDLQGHGRSTLGDRPIDLAAMADDLAFVLAELGYERLDVMGYSLGGVVALRLAIQHPEHVHRLAVVSSAFAHDGYHPEVVEAQAMVSAAAMEQLRPTPMYQAYAAIAPDPDGFPRLLDRMGELLRTPYDLSGGVRRLTMPVLLVFGDSDMYRMDHIVDFYRLLGGGLRDAGFLREQMSRNRLAILPGVTHYDIFASPEMVAVVNAFLAVDGEVRR